MSIILEMNALLDSMDSNVTDRKSATAAGVKWAESRHSSTRTRERSDGNFQLDDALSSISSKLPEKKRADLAHDMCAAASRRWKELVASEK